MSGGSRAAAPARARPPQPSRLQDPGSKTPNGVVRLCFVSLCLYGALPAGCDRSAPAPPPIDPGIRLATPEETARSLLVQIQQWLSADAQGDRARGRAARDQIVWHMVARDEILGRHRVRAGKEDAVVVEAVRSWAAMLSYYAAGLDLDAAEVVDGADRGRCFVHVPARGEADLTTVRIGCVQTDGGTWRVRSFELVPAEVHAAATRAAPAPETAQASTAPAASAPAPAVSPPPEPPGQ